LTPHIYLQVATFKAPPFFTFHTANAYEEAGVVHVDFCGYDDPEVREGGAIGSRF
jgi:carotenoid cleavage dioxygenase-like enzyme